MDVLIKRRCLALCLDSFFIIFIVLIMRFIELLVAASIAIAAVHAAPANNNQNVNTGLGGNLNFDLGAKPNAGATPNAGANSDSIQGNTKNVNNVNDNDSVVINMGSNNHN
ncbi:hypothetical protein EDC96DRAFT_609621 [Choanephora cucurbitarum]|nr:hypothetical protein EDC96DRAFT_609621 [Choanephora cucurbitarum]